MSRILVAEDDPHILRVISLWLSRQGHEVLEARNGLTARELVQQQRPEILITDINMPGMDGLGLLKQLVQQEHVPRGIVVLTNRWDHREIGNDLAQWGVRVVPKPFSPTRLAELIAQLDEQVSSQPTDQEQ
jgi:CheY-like chemotaxis protein